MTEGKTSSEIASLRIGPEKNFTYMISCSKTGEIALVDPAFEFDKIHNWLINRTRSLSPKVRYLLATHGHWDHAGGMNEMKKLFPEAKIVAHVNERERLAQLNVRADVEVQDGTELFLGDTSIHCFHTPGHTEGGCCYKVGREIFTGDTLFIDQCGRTDLSGGSDRDLFSSLQKLKAMDQGLLIRPGHDYGPRPYATLKDQLATNPTLVVKTLREFSNLS